MEIVMIYEGKDFWGRSITRSDHLRYPNKDHLLACFRNLKKEPMSAVHITGYAGEAELVLYWDSWSDQEKGELSMKVYSRINSYDIKKMDFDKAKTFVRNTVGM